MTTITAGSSTITPTLVLGYEAQSESTNVVHRVIGRSNPDYTIGFETLRSGTLRLLFDTRAAAFTALALHRTVSVFTLADTDVPQADMTYIRTGAMTIGLDPETRIYWTLEVGFEEVSP